MTQSYCNRLLDAVRIFLGDHSLTKASKKKEFKLDWQKYLGFCVKGAAVAVTVQR